MNRYDHSRVACLRIRSGAIAWCVGWLSLIMGATAQASIVIEQLHQMMGPSSTTSTPQSSSSSDAHDEALGIVYILSSQCPYCQSFSPILADVSRELQLPVYPYSVDGHGLPEFPTPMIAHEAILQMFYRGQPIIYPATFLVNLDSRTSAPFSVGAVSREQLIQDYYTYQQHPTIRSVTHNPALTKTQQESDQ